MKLEELGINIDTLPSLVLNEDKGRELLRHISANEGFKEILFLTKFAMFKHQCEDHLQIELGKTPSDAKAVGRYLTQLFKDKPNLSITWEMVNRSIDRHIFLILTAYASIEDNLAEPDDIDLVGCSAYLHSFIDVAFAMMEAHSITARMAADIRYGSGEDVSEAFDTAYMAASAVTRTISSIKYMTMLFISKSDKDYGIGTRYDVKRE